MDLVVIWQAGHVLEEVTPVTLGASVGSIIAMDLVVSVVDRKAGHVSEEVAPHTFGARVGSIRAVDLILNKFFLDAVHSVKHWSRGDALDELSKHDQSI